MENVKAFLYPKKPEIQEVAVSDRFVDEKGEIILWKIRPVTNQESDMLLLKNKKKQKDGKEVFHKIGYLNDLAALSVVYPDLKDAKLQEAYGALGETDVLNKMLYVGEFQALLKKVQTLCGFFQTGEVLEEQAKN